jgi:ankyrin repeat protein
MDDTSSVVKKNGCSSSDEDFLLLKNLPPNIAIVNLLLLHTEKENTRVAKVIIDGDEDTSEDEEDTSDNDTATIKAPADIETDAEKKFKHNCYLELLGLKNYEAYQYGNLKTPLLHRNINDIPHSIINVKSNVENIIKELKSQKKQSGAVLQEIGQLYYFLGNYAQSIRYLKKAAYLEIQQNIKNTQCLAINLIDQLGIAYINSNVDNVTSNSFYSLAETKANVRKNQPHLDNKRADELALKLYLRTCQASINAKNFDSNNPFIHFIKLTDYLKKKKGKKILELIHIDEEEKQGYRNKLKRNPSPLRAITLEFLEIIASSSHSPSAVVAKYILNSEYCVNANISYSSDPFLSFINALDGKKNQSKKNNEQNDKPRYPGYWTYNFTPQDVLSLQPNKINGYAIEKNWMKVIQIAQEFPVQDAYFGLKTDIHCYRYALRQAMHAGIIEAIVALADAGTTLAYVYDNDKKFSALHYIIKLKTQENSGFRIRSGPVPPKIFHKATKAEIVATLIDKGADLAAKDKEGSTPIVEAAQYVRSKGVAECITAIAKKTPTKNSFFQKDIYNYAVALTVVANNLEYNNRCGVAVDAINALLDSHEKMPFSINYNKPVSFNTYESGNTDGNTALHGLIDCKLFSVQGQMARLIKMGADLTIKNKKGKTPMKLAVDRAIEIKNKNICKGRNAREFIKVTAIANNFTVPKTIFHRWDAYSFGYALFFALVHNQTEAAMALLNANAPLVNYDAGDNTGNKLLHYVVLNKNADPDLIRDLIRAGADLSAKNKEGRTPAELAAINENWAVLKILAETAKTEKFLFNKDTYNYGKALVMAEYFGKDDIADALLAAGASVNEKDDKGNTALHYAALHEHFNIVQQCIVKKSNINAVNHEGNTALHMAFLKGNRDIVEYLIKQGADLSIKNKEGNTPIQLIGSEKGSGVIKLVLEDFDKDHIPEKNSSIFKSRIFTDDHLKELLELIIDKFETDHAKPYYQKICYELGDFLIGKGSPDNALVFLLMAGNYYDARPLIHSCYVQIIKSNKNYRELEKPLLLLEFNELKSTLSVPEIKNNIRALIEQLELLGNKNISITKEIGMMYYFMGNYSNAIDKLTKATFKEVEKVLRENKLTNDMIESIEFLDILANAYKSKAVTPQFHYSFEHKDELVVYAAVKKYLIEKNISPLFDALKNTHSKVVAAEYIEIIWNTLIIPGVLRVDKHAVDTIPESLSEYYFDKKEYDKAYKWEFVVQGVEVLSIQQKKLLQCEEIRRQLDHDTRIKLLTSDNNNNIIDENLLKNFINESREAHYVNLVVTILQKEELYRKLSRDYLIKLYSNINIKTALNDTHKTNIIRHIVKTRAINISDLEQWFGLLERNMFQSLCDYLCSCYTTHRLQHNNKTPAKVIYALILLNANNPGPNIITVCFDRYPELTNINDLHLLFDLIEKSQHIEKKHKDTWKKIVRDFAFESWKSLTDQIKNPAKQIKALQKSKNELIFSENRHPFFKAINRETSTVKKIKLEQTVAVNKFFMSYKDKGLMMKVNDEFKKSITEDIVENYKNTKTIGASTESEALFTLLSSDGIELQDKFKHISEYMLDQKNNTKEGKKLYKIIQNRFIDFLGKADEKKDSIGIIPLTVTALIPQLQLVFSHTSN